MYKSAEKNFYSILFSISCLIPLSDKLNNISKPGSLLGRAKESSHEIQIKTEKIVVFFMPDIW